LVDLFECVKMEGPTTLNF